MATQTVTQVKTKETETSSCSTPTECYGDGLGGRGCLWRPLSDGVAMRAHSYRTLVPADVADRALAYHNEQVLGRYARKMNLGLAEAQERWAELMRFLSLCASTSNPCTPSNELDQLWHEFVLHTRAYAEFCANILGVYVHHTPSDQPEAETYAATRWLMFETFGSVAERLWPELAGAAADCSGKTCTGYCDDDVTNIPEIILAGACR